ncbi:hypothetical protein REPUB_Repub14bG0052300 [Reevesia pubescens]
MAMAIRTSAGGRTRVGKYGLGRTLGEGTFTKVKFARNIQTGENVVIKILDKEKVLKHKMIGQKNKSEIKKTIEELDEKKKETLKLICDFRFDNSELRSVVIVDKRKLRILFLCARVVLRSFCCQVILNLDITKKVELSTASSGNSICNDAVQLVLHVPISHNECLAEYCNGWHISRLARDFCKSCSEAQVIGGFNG